jgi:hypothetical protein
LIYVSQASYNKFSRLNAAGISRFLDYPLFLIICTTSVADSISDEVTGFFN